jgi:hypothetical protein
MRLDRDQVIKNSKKTIRNFFDSDLSCFSAKKNSKKITGQKKGCRNTPLDNLN